MKKITTKKLIVAKIAALLFLNVSSAFANPSELDLSFKYSSRGTLAIDVAFDEEATSKCIARHRVSLYHEGQVAGDSGVIRRSVFNRVVPAGRKSTSLRASRLLGAKKKNGKDPILAVQTRLVCGDLEIDSNIVARYVICGDNTRRLSLNSYHKQLVEELE